MTGIDQLISEDWSTGYTADYEYDANGNRTKRTVGATVEDYFYDDSDKLTEIKIGGTVTKSFDYDVNGRRTEMTDGGGTTYYGYDMGDRLTSITRSGLTTNSFSYNGFDTRVSKTDSTGTTSYKRAGAGVTSSLLKSTVSSTTTDYTPGISSRISSTSTFMHSGLKNSDEQSGSGGTIAASLQYDAFGKQVSSSGTWVGAFKYGGAYGYQTDPDHGLKLLGHRYYEADTGRFLTRDPIKDGRNWYGYCGNGPLRRADPNGLSWHDPLVIYVDPNFGGSVIVIGEPGPGKPPCFTIVRPGCHSNPKMDVDYVIINHPNGDQTIKFAAGLSIPGFGTDIQLGTVTKDGELVAPGPVIDLVSYTNIFWAPNLIKGLQRTVPTTCAPEFGPYLIQKKRTNRKRADTPRPMIPVGAQPGGSGSLRWN